MLLPVDDSEGGLLSLFIPILSPQIREIKLQRKCKLYINSNAISFSFFWQNLSARKMSKISNFQNEDSVKLTCFAV